MTSIRTLIVSAVTVFSFFVFGTGYVQAQQKVFTATDLAQYDGVDGHPAYFAYKGKVYDASQSKFWKLGVHFGLHAGKDLTGLMEKAPHGDEVLAKVPLVGTYTAAPSKSWFDAPIEIFGIPIIGWTGIFLAIAFVLNFATCFALPWSKLPVPWAGSRPGPDPLDGAPTHKNLASIHKYFAWATVVLGAIHGVLGLLQIFFKIYI